MHCLITKLKSNDLILCNSYTFYVYADGFRTRKYVYGAGDDNDHYCVVIEPQCNYDCDIYVFCLTDLKCYFVRNFGQTIIVL